jgi:hypothetical protein
MSEPTDGRKDETHAQRERRKADEQEDRKKIITALEAIAQKPDRTENKGRVEKCLKWFVDLGTLAGIWFAAVIAICAIRGASNDSGGQLSEMKAEQRAWVYGDIVPNGDATYDKGDLKLSFKVTLHNVGHHPAAYVFPLIYGTPQDRTFSQKDGALGIQEGICDREKSKHLPERISQAEGRTVFPGEEDAVLTIPVTVASTDTRYPASTDKDGFTPIILGCIAYQFISDKSWHETGFMFRLERDGPQNPMIAPEFHISEGNIPAAKLHLVPFVSGRGFYAY